MGFFLEDSFAEELKQHLNLSDSARLVIDEDIREFDPDHESFSGFLNTIFLNFYQEAEASIWLRKQAKLEELNSVFANSDFAQMDPKAKTLFIQKSIVLYQDELLEKAHAYPKGRGQKIHQKFRINKEMLDVIKGSNEYAFYDNTIGEYLKAIYEEYALLPRYRREAIYFKDTIDIVKQAITHETKIKIAQFSKSNVAQTKRYSNQFYLTPYKIVQDATYSFNYILAYSERINKQPDPNEINETRLGNPTTFRVSRIAKITEITSMGGHISKENKEHLDKLLAERTAAYLATPPEDIVVLFSEKGLDSFRNQIYMRPLDYEIGEKKADGSAEIVFHCSDIQAMNYLFKLGREIEVLSPETLRQKFIARYNDALAVYQKKDPA